MDPIATDGAPYGIINFDALWWIIIGVVVIVIAAFYALTYALTKPIKGDDDSQFTLRTPAVTRALFSAELQSIDKNYTTGETNVTDTVNQAHDLIIKFLQSKTKVDITGYTYEQLSKIGAPEDLLETVSQTYHILYAKSTPTEKQYRTAQLLSTTRDVITRWR